MKKFLKIFKKKWKVIGMNNKKINYGTQKNKYL